MAFSAPGITFLFVAVLLLLLNLLSKGECQCDIHSLNVIQGLDDTTNNSLGNSPGKNMYGVAIYNNCPCQQSSIILNCFGLYGSTSVSKYPPDPNHINVDNTSDSMGCAVKNGGSMAPFEIMYTTYASIAEVNLTGKSSDVACS